MQYYALNLNWMPHARIELQHYVYVNYHNIYSISISDSDIVRNT